MASSTHCGVCALLHVIEARQSTFLSVRSLSGTWDSAARRGASAQGRLARPLVVRAPPPRRRSWGRSWGICKLIGIVPHLIIVYV
jgi:hypothetical protein